MKTLAWLPVLAAACTQPTRGITGPFTGEVQRYVIDRFDLPTNSNLAEQYGDDLDGNGRIDNELGQVIATLAGENDLNRNAGDMHASGVLVSSITIQADDLSDDPTVGVWYVGADGDPATVMGGSIANGTFVANLTRDTTVPGAARVRLPVFANADPAIFDLQGMELTLVPDGAGGYTGLVRGVVRAPQALDVAAAGIWQMLVDDPVDHLELERYLVNDNSSPLTAPGLLHSTLLLSLLAPDVTMFDDNDFVPDPRNSGPDSVSLGFAVHLVPCASGSCASSPVVDPCSDRVRDGDETDIDCGGSCGACPANAACAIAADCQSQACSLGSCADATCSDGVRDGFESDVDCGGGCAKCGFAQQCVFDTDCSSGHCNNGPRTQSCGV